MFIWVSKCTNHIVHFAQNTQTINAMYKCLSLTAVMDMVGWLLTICGCPGRIAALCTWFGHWSLLIPLSLSARHWPTWSSRSWGWPRRTRRQGGQRRGGASTKNMASGWWHPWHCCTRSPLCPSLTKTWVLSHCFDIYYLRIHKKWHTFTHCMINCFILCTIMWEFL